MRKLSFLILFLFCYELSSSQDYSVAPVLVNAKDLIDKGIKSYDEGKYEESIAFYHQIPENDTAYSLALYEEALGYRGLKKPLESVKLLKKGLTLRSETKRSFYEMLGSAYDEAGDFQNSIKTFRDGLREFPDYDMFYHEMGVTFAGHKDGDSALANMIKAVQLNPLRPANHLKLSAFMLKNNQLIPAMMSFLIYSSLETNTSRSFAQLAAYEKILKREESFNSDSALKLSSFNPEQFAEIEQIVNSNMAVSKDYKVPGKINYPYLIKNFHVLMEKIQVSGSGKDIWNSLYIETLKKIYKEKSFEVFILNIFAAVDKEDIQKEVKKKKKDIDEFNNWLVSLLYDKYMKDRTSIVNGKPISADHGYYGNGNLKSICTYNEAKKINTGPGYYYYKNGVLKAEGRYNDAGKKDGEWKYYTAEGVISSLETYSAEVLNGPFVSYHPNGTVKEKGTYVKGIVDGEVQFYYSNGALRKVNQYKKDYATGAETEYSDNGVISHTATVGENNAYEGEIRTYFSNGNPNYVANYKKGLYDGSYKTYYENSGKLKQEGAFLNDKRSGKLTDYFESGKVLKVEDGYTGGKLTGSYVSYNENGSLSEKGTYQSDMLEGEYIVNDSTGKMYTKYVYDKNNLKKAFYYGPDGKVIDQVNASGKKYLFKKYYENGALYETGSIADNNREGPWKQYFRNGNLRQEMIYKAGKFEGVCKTFFRHGQLKTEVNYAADEKEGLYKEYYPSGTLKQQGWYVKGTAQQNFYNYSETGVISSDVYLFDGERKGPMKLFDVTGKLNYVQYYDKGVLYRVESYDTLGNIINNAENNFGNGKLAWYHPNGKLSTEVDYRYGYENGLKKVYHSNGTLYFEANSKNGSAWGPYRTYNTYKKIMNESFYKNDQLDSVYTQFDFEGNKISVMNYKYNDLNGERKWYYYNGKLEVTGVYKDDERNGVFKYYAPDGTLMLQKNYIDGVFTAYSYLGTGGQMTSPVQVDNKKQAVLSYFPNGKKSMEFTMVFGSMHGALNTWYPNGNKKEEYNRFYDDYEGQQKEYYENGNLRSEEFFKADNRSGECKYYYETGKVRRITHYLNGNKHGKETLYDTAGKKTSEIIFYDGEIAK